MPREPQKAKGIPEDIIDSVVEELRAEFTPELRTKLEQRARCAAALDWLRSKFPAGDIKIVAGKAKIGPTEQDSEEFIAPIRALQKPSSEQSSDRVAALSDADWQIVLQQYIDQFLALSEKIKSDLFKPAITWLERTYENNIKKHEDRGDQGDKGKKSKGPKITINGLPLDTFRKHKKPTEQDRDPAHPDPDLAKIIAMDDDNWQAALETWIDKVMGGPEKRELIKAAKEWLNSTYGYRIHLEGYKVIIAGFDSQELAKRDKPSEEEALELKKIEKDDWQATLKEWVKAVEIKARKNWREPTYFEIAVYLDATYGGQVRKQDGQLMVGDETAAVFLESNVPSEFEGLDREKWKQYKTSWLANIEKQKWPASPTMEEMYNRPPVSTVQPAPEVIEQRWRDRPMRVVEQYERLQQQSGATRQPDQAIEDYLRHLDSWRDAKASLREAAGFALGVLSMIADKSVKSTLGRLTRSGKLKTEASLMAGIFRDILFERGVARFRGEIGATQHQTDIQLRLSALNARIHELTLLGLPKGQIAPLYERLVRMVDERTELETGFEQELTGVLRDFFARKGKEREKAA